MQRRISKKQRRRRSHCPRIELLERRNLLAAVLKIDNIKGDSAVEGHAGEIDLNRFGFNVSRTDTDLGSGNVAIGVPHFTDLSFVKGIDQASHRLMEEAAIGKQHSEGTVFQSFSLADNELSQSLKIEVSDAIFSSYQMDNGGDNIENTFETSSMLFSKIKLQYEQAKDSGSTFSGKVQTEWDLKNNKPVANAGIEDDGIATNSELYLEINGKSIQIDAFDWNALRTVEFPGGTTKAVPDAAHASELSVVRGVDQVSVGLLSAVTSGTKLGDIKLIDKRVIDKNSVTFMEWTLHEAESTASLWMLPRHSAIRRTLSR
ncbi:MAG: type VI secretion system tube protein Hcp [Pirellulaceae bacterium]